MLNSVTFRYPGSEQVALENVSLTIPAGSTVALVGENGAGKSTLAKLLCRLYEPTVGSITLAGRPLTEVTSDAWQAAVAVGFQDYCRYEFTVAQAIGVGELRRVEDRHAILAAAARGGASELIGQLPDGLASQLGRSFDGGLELSGGQWQALAISRTMMRTHPVLLILDEPTASLDPVAEQTLFDKYLADREPAMGRITVLISHRFGTVRSADLIVVLASGRVSEVGSHAQLMAHGGSYAELWTTQAAGYR